MRDAVEEGPVTRSSDTAASQPRSITRTVMHSVGNVLLGFSLGILSYYLITDLVTRFEQERLRVELQELGGVGATSPDRLLRDDDTGIVWDGWESEDLDYWEALSDGEVFGRLVSEEAGIDVVVLKGTTREILKRGPGWIAYTDPPGPSGNTGISGHRTTYGAPFRRLDDLAKGDDVYFYSPFRRYTYQVSEVFSVTPDRVDVVASTESPRLTLTACDPPYSARYRLIVWCELTEVRRLEGGPDRSGT